MAIRVSRQLTEVLAEQDADLRVSRQLVEVLAEQDPEMRVSRQYVEVLVPGPVVWEASTSSALSFGQLAERDTLVMSLSASSALSLLQTGIGNIVGNVSASSTLLLTQSTNTSPKNLSASSTLLLAQETNFPGTHLASANSTISFTDSAINSGTLSASVSSILTLVQYADDDTKWRDVESTLTITDTASVDKILQGFSTLSLTQVAETSRHLFASSQLSLTQSARQQVQKLYATSQIEFSQDNRVNPRFISASNTLELTQETIVTKPIRVSASNSLTVQEWVWVLDELVLTDTGLRQEASTQSLVAYSASSVIGLTHSTNAYAALASGTSASASSTLSFSDSAKEAIEASSTSTLVFSQAATGDAAKPSSSTLSLTQTASSTIDRGLLTTTTLGLTQSTTYTLIIGSTVCQYSPFVGDSSDSNAPDPPPATIDGPMVGISVPFQLVYPSIGVVTDSVSLKTPNLGNKDRSSFQRVLRETRGGTLIVYADPIWPKTQTLAITFSGLLRVEAQELLTFVDTYLGQEIGLIDWEHRYWRGVIKTPDEPAIEDKFDSFTVNMEFEGELDSTWNPQIVPEGLRYSATRSTQQDGYYVPPNPALPGTPESIAYYTATTDNLTKTGNPLYLTVAGHVDLAKADADSTAQVVGLSQADYTVGQACNYLTEGRIERTDWTIIAGTTDLSIGATYFLDPNTEGHITTTAPTTAGQFVVRVGRAVDARTLDIEIELPILL